MPPAGTTHVWSIRITAALLVALGAAFLATTILGAVRSYAPVPFWDMWDAYLGSYLQLYDGHWVAFLFWQTNEHRIVLTKILFWLDLRFFGGESALLIPANIALLVCLWGALCAIAWGLLRDRKDLLLITCAAIAPLCLSWMQQKNIVWGLQNTWLMAYLFPLLAFASFAVFTSNPQRRRWFVVALVCGILSMGTLASGLIVLPMLIGMQLLSNPRQWRRAVIIGVVAALFTGAWFHLYYPVDRGPVEASRFLTSFVSLPGLPFFRAALALQRWPAETLEPLAFAGGAAFLVIAAAFAVWWLRTRRQQNPLVLALLTFMAYIEIASVAIAVGRSNEIAFSALVDRYATLSLLGWASLVVLGAYRFRTSLQAPAAYGLAAICIAALMYPNQRDVFGPDGSMFAHEETLAGLALSMHVDDVPAIAVIYPVDDPRHKALMASYVAAAEHHKLSIFGDGRWTRAIAHVGKAAFGHPCQSAIDTIARVETDPRYRRVDGWAFDEKTKRAPPFVYFANGDTITGIAVTGAPRPDVAKNLRGAPPRAGFSGYMVSGADAPPHILCPDRRS
jgi:hypothetical protein